MSRSGLRRILPARPLGSGFLVAVGVILAVALALAVASLSSVLLSLVLALFLALALDPAVVRLQQLGLSRGWGVGVVAAAFLVLVGLIIAFVVPATIRQFVAAVAAAPETIAEIESSDWFRSLEQTLGVDVEAAVAAAIGSAVNISSFLAVSGGVLRVGFGIVGAISSTFIVVVLTLYFVSSLRSMKESLASLIPEYRRARFRALLEQITGSVGGVIAGAIMLSSFNAVVVFVLQLAIGSPIAVVMAITAFFITLIPLIGSLLFWVIGSACALLAGPWAALIFLVAYFAYIQVEAYVITPRIMGRTVAVPGVLVIIGAMIGATLMGLIGALVAIPVTASILIIVRQVVIPAQNAKTRANDLTKGHP